MKNVELAATNMPRRRNGFGPFRTGGRGGCCGGVVIAGE
jgi:hypothetical protein